MARLSLDIEEQITEAVAFAHNSYPYEVASTVRYMPGEDLLLIVLKSGERVAIPVENLQELADKNRAAVACFEMVESGRAIRWEQLDVDFSVAGLAEGRYGNERWMQRLREKRRADASAALSETA